MTKRSCYLLITVVFACSACASAGKTESQPIAVEKTLILPTSVDDVAKSGKNGEEKTVNKLPAVPDFVPVSEDLSPLKTRIVSISARNKALKDVLFVISEATGLNLVMESGVNPEIPITVTLNEVTAEVALETVLSSVDYSHSVKGNILTVRSTETRIFEFGQPSVIQDYAVNVGGDILGGGSSTAGGSSGVKGNVVQSVQSDKDATKLWDSIEKTIRSIIGEDAAPSPVAPGPSVPPAQSSQAGSTTVQVQSHINVNRMTGTIVVSSTKKDLEKVGEYLMRLKKILGRQVIIEARVVEVQLSNGLKYGIDWSAIGNSGGDVNITSSANRFTDVVSQSAPNFQIGVASTNFTGLLTALQTQGDIKVLSNPRINIMNGQTALLSVGRNTNFISKVETTTTPGSGGTPATTTFSVMTQSVLSGVMIGMAPIVNENGEISMAITPIISDLVKLEDRTVGTVGQNTIQISLPTVDLRELNTTVKIKDNEMVIIGGLIQNKDRVQDNQVPFLGQIPLLGYLFKSREMVKDKTELVIMLKPTVVAF